MRINQCRGFVFLGFLAAASVITTVAASKNKLDARVRDLTDYFASVQQDASKAVPAEILSKAEGLVIMRNYKAGFIVGISGGHGVALLKDKSGTWGPVGFVKAGEGSFGFQAGAQRNDLILVLMNKEGVSVLTDPNLKLGVDIRATVGRRARGTRQIFVRMTHRFLFMGTRAGFSEARRLKPAAFFRMAVTTRSTTTRSSP
jgi:lipid-binding SYLF domain-containing protein